MGLLMLLLTNTPSAADPNTVITENIKIIRIVFST
jgi:hypothetical protein